jgi:hypothetical protein
MGTKIGYGFVQAEDAVANLTLAPDLRMFPAFCDIKAGDNED